MKQELLARLRTARRPVVLATALDTGEQMLLSPDGPDAGGLVEQARHAVQRDRATTVDTERGPVFLEVFNSPLRLVLVGAVHIAQPLARMAALAGFATVVVDPRAAFATEARFPGVERSTLWPDEALAQIAPDRRTAVITLTHDPKLDDPALAAALRSPAFYVGCLGSQKTHAARLGRLREMGFGDAELARLRGPVGLRIGARTPAEIAISILAQVVETLRGGEEPESR
ncbi:MAG TPA: XdhC family protein [Haliangiales bacterium]|nr:XdhC family protein [Haliangiales bacterium]